MEDRLNYLFRRYLDNTCSFSELEEFLGYVKKAEYDVAIRQSIRKLYAEMKETAPPLTHVDGKGRLVLTEPELPDTLPQQSTERRPSKMIRVVSIAAFLLLMAGFIWMGKNKVSDQVTAVASLTRKTTDRSESKFLLLADSTKVWLNAASSLEFPDQFSPDRREVYLSGEAFFDVQHADKIPFIIHTGKISTTVLGTSFNIKAYPGQKNVTVSVSRGKVRVSRTDGWVTTLHPGQEVRVEEYNQVREKTIAPSEVAAWQQGTIYYDDETMHDIISDMERIYNVNIEIMDPSILDLTISTSFKKNIGVEQALQVLCKLTDKELENDEGSYLIK